MVPCPAPAVPAGACTPLWVGGVYRELYETQFRKVIEMETVQNGSAT